MPSAGEHPPTESDEAIETVASLVGDREFLVVSNREPYVHERADGELTVTRPAGGLTSALDPVMRELGGTWIAWGSGDADREVCDATDVVRVPPDEPAYDLRRVWLSEAQVAGYYYGYSNQVLWPICHTKPERATFDAEFWDRYREVNRTFADAVVDECTRDGSPVVWFQDYHFALAPRQVRDRVPDAFLVQFWHVPWPGWDAFRRCPQYESLLAGLLGNDLLGFHTDRYCRNFLDCVEAGLDATVDRTTGTVEYDGRTTYVRSFPLGVDTASCERRARSREGTGFWRAFEREHGLEDVRVALGVDRLDYTKGIPERLDALERLWETHPEWQGELTYLQKASESRSQIPAYREYQREVEARVDAVNERFGTDDWQPVVYWTDHLSQAELAGLYRGADIALVSPLCDGMNLVAKEYVASQVEDDGVLVLSELAGASEELGDAALTVHPYDTAGFAATIADALTMDQRERRERMRRLRTVVNGSDTYTWLESVVRTVLAIERGGTRQTSELRSDIPEPG